MRRTKVSCSFPVDHQSVQDAGGFAGLQRDCQALGLDGVEAVWGGDDTIEGMPPALAVGYHLLFYPDWLDFWRGDKAALRRKFGSLEAAQAFYGGEGQECLLQQYRADLTRAQRLQAAYVVFHVSDVSIEEGYTYQWQHTNEEVIDAAVDLINRTLDGLEAPFAVLVENQWWPGFTFLEPMETQRLLDGIQHPDKGVLLDIGHLMNTNTHLATEQEGAAYICSLLRKHGALSQMVRGVHLHQSLSGAYVQTHTGALPTDLPEEYLARFRENYSHILQIDRHQPWTDPAIAAVLEEIAPEWITHELAAASKNARWQAVKKQMDTLRKGGFPR